MTQPVNLRAQQEKRTTETETNLNSTKRSFKLDYRKKISDSKGYWAKDRLPREIVKDTIIKEFNTVRKEH